MAVSSKRRKRSIHEGKSDSVQTNDRRTETRNTKLRKLKGDASDVRIQLPQGIMLNGIAAIDLPTRDVAHALQFLEFCEAFREVSVSLVLLSSNSNRSRTIPLPVKHTSFPIFIILSFNNLQLQCLY